MRWASAGDPLPPHGDGRHRDRRSADRRGRQGRAAGTGRPTGTSGCSTTRTASTSPARTPRSRSATAPAGRTSASAPTSPGGRSRVMFEELLRRLPDLRITGEPDACRAPSSTASSGCRAPGRWSSHRAHGIAARVPSGRRRCRAALGHRLAVGRQDVPDVADALAVDVTGGGVLGEVVERPVVVGDLLTRRRRRASPCRAAPRRRRRRPSPCRGTPATLPRSRPRTWARLWASGMNMYSVRPSPSTRIVPRSVSATARQSRRRRRAPRSPPVRSLPAGASVAAGAVGGGGCVSRRRSGRGRRCGRRCPMRRRRRRRRRRPRRQAGEHGGERASAVRDDVGFTRGPPYG